jgi:hypothetical protein
VVSESIRRNNDDRTVFNDERVGVFQLLTYFTDFRSGFAGVQYQWDTRRCDTLQRWQCLLPAMAVIVEQGSIKIRKYNQSRPGHGRLLGR